MKSDRRKFLKLTGAAISGFPAFLRGANLNSVMEVAVVGCGGQGFEDLVEIGSHPRVRLVGFCDVDSTRFQAADQKFRGVRHFQDFREMFSQLDYDAVQVSTPDHMHALISLQAMSRGKHVYCQKPLSHTLWEARQIRAAAERAKVVTQMGNQMHSCSQYRTAVKLIRSGTIGKISAVHSWFRGNGAARPTQPPPAAPVPATLNWDGWLGGAPVREFAPDVYHPFKWRDWQDFGSGTLGDFGCHILDPVFTALGLGAPLSVESESEGLNPQSWPFAETIRYQFAKTAFIAGEALWLTWYDGGRQPDLALAQMPAGKKLPSAGSLWIGEGGVMVLPHVGVPQLYPESGAFSFELEPRGNHYRAWVEAALAGTQTSDHFEYAGLLTESVHLGNLAARYPGIRLQWDPASMRFPNHPEAERWLTKRYRAGWEIGPQV